MQGVIGQNSLLCISNSVSDSFFEDLHGHLQVHNPYSFLKTKVLYKIFSLKKCTTNRRKKMIKREVSGMNLFEGF